jgi:hypothetical protein
MERFQSDIRLLRAMTADARFDEIANHLPLNPASCKSDVGIFLRQHEQCGKNRQKVLEKLSITDKVYNQNKLAIEI